MAYLQRKLRKERIEAYKKEHDIETHNAGFRKRSDHPWSACWMKAARKIEYLGILATDGIGEACAKGCRILEEDGYLVTGPTEAAAVCELAIINELPLPL